VPTVLPSPVVAGQLQLGPAGGRGLLGFEDLPGSVTQNCQSLEGKILVLYLAVAEHAVSAILVVERAKEQIPVYYISHALAGAKVNYPLIEKFAYTFVMASQKLGPYFEAHKILVLTDQSLKNVLQKLDASGWLLK